MSLKLGLNKNCLVDTSFNKIEDRNRRGNTWGITEFIFESVRSSTVGYFIDFTGESQWVGFGLFVFILFYSN